MDLKSASRGRSIVFGLLVRPGVFLPGARGGGFRGGVFGRRVMVGWLPRGVVVALRDARVLARYVAARKFARVRRARRTWRRDLDARNLRARRLAVRNLFAPPMVVLRAARKGRRERGWRLATHLLLLRATNHVAWRRRDSEDFLRARSDPAAGKACARVHRLLPAWLFPLRCDSPLRT